MISHWLLVRLNAETWGELALIGMGSLFFALTWFRLLAPWRRAAKRRAMRARARGNRRLVINLWSGTDDLQLQRKGGDA